MVNEELPVGTKIPCRFNRTIDEGDFSLLHSTLWIIHPIHVDAEYAKNAFSGQRNLAAPIILAVADGLVQISGGLDEFLAKYGKKIAAYVGIDNVRFSRPVLAGDTLIADVEVTGIRPTKNPDRGILSYTNKAYNQRNELVVKYTSRILFEKKR